VAARAGGDVDHLAEHRLAHAPDLAPAAALRAGRRRVLPGAAPLPAQVAQRSSTSNSISFSMPRTASSKVIRRS
jgi:hypothetical protein